MTHVAFENVKELPIDLTKAVDQVASDTFLLSWEILEDQCSGFLKWNDCSCAGSPFRDLYRQGSVTLLTVVTLFHMVASVILHIA